jgi:polysaccharide deacetylase family protein (PEP-CTERM system associated)
MQRELPSLREQVHAISVDVEDWYQSVVDGSAELTERFRGNTYQLLELFAEHGVMGTFFVLGLAAKRAPELVRAIAAAGHEIASHGYGHELVFRLKPDDFRQNLLRTKGMLEDLAQADVLGFRAPDFSIDHRTPWALDILVQTGHRYDSSLFPIKMPRYGIDGANPAPHALITHDGSRLVEAPIACFQCLGRRLPVGGGGYFRLWPYPVIRYALRQMEREKRPGVIYIHPYECDTEELRQCKSRIPFGLHITQNLGRTGFKRKLHQVMSDFCWAPLRQVLSDLLGDVRSCKQEKSGGDFARR